MHQQWTLSLAPNSDEAYVGGAVKGRNWHSSKTIVMGMKERGGYIRTEVIPNATMKTLHEVTMRNIEPGSVISTDEWKAYNLLTDNNFHHGAVNHSAKQWAVTISR